MKPRNGMYPTDSGRRPDAKEHQNAVKPRNTGMRCPRKNTGFPCFLVLRIAVGMGIFFCFILLMGMLPLSGMWESSGWGRVGSIGSEVVSEILSPAGALASASPGKQNIPPLNALPSEPLRQNTLHSREGFVPILRAIGELNPEDTPAGGGIAAGQGDIPLKSGRYSRKKTAAFIKKYFEETGIKNVGAYPFFMPELMHRGSCLTLLEKQLDLPLIPLKYNAVTPQSTGDGGFSAHLVFADKGRITDFNGWQVKDAVVLMDIHSGKNWLNAANLGAGAVVFYDSGTADKSVFREKSELTPIHFPMFRISREILENALGPLTALTPAQPVRVTLQTAMAWERQQAENIYAVIPGTDESLAGELVIVEAFYDAEPVSGRSFPGPDQLCSIATLLALADYLTENPPARSVMLVATAGHDKALAGWRDMMWSLATKSKELKKEKKMLASAVTSAEEALSSLEKCMESLPGRGGKETARISLDHLADPSGSRALQQAIQNRLAMRVDDISQELMALRMGKKGRETDSRIKILAKRRFAIRQMGWATDYTRLSSGERDILAELIRLSAGDYQRTLNSLGKQLKVLKKALKFRKAVKNMSVKAVLSLHLSSHGDGFGGFDRGWLYSPLRARINRTGALRRIEEIFRESSRTWQDKTALPSRFRDTLRPSRMHPWESWFLDQPFLGGEVSALAGYPGLTLATVNDARSFWGTPLDTFDRVELENASRQSREVSHLIHSLCVAPEIKQTGKIRNGFSTVTGRCRLQLHGELFAEHPAPETLIFSFQGKGRYHAMSDVTGTFRIKGVADKKHLLDKVIIEGYRFNASDGSVKWAVDKKLTGKPAYRLKVKRRNMETDLIMFNARQTTLFNLMEPRNFNYMTKIKLFDGRRDAPPLKYWYSRIDTRASILTSIFLEPGTRLKLTLSESILRKKLILTNATEEKPLGRGYPVDEQPFIHHTQYRVATDMWHLITPRVANLEKKGIFNHRINTLQKKGLEWLTTAEHALKDLAYDRFMEASLASWALAIRVYEDVERTQKDVLFGVLFYIALFVPFAFCLERLLFGFTNIYRRIAGFFTILVLQIAIVYNVHPAFQLAYSPLVIIIAFFIIGLSLLVSLIIFFRFEREMILLQRKATHMRQEEISSFKAFIAAFFLGVSNLRRRRVRTALTCTTLILLTFTIMGFTTVKSLRSQARTQVSDSALRPGFLMKQFNWNDLPSEALSILENAFAGKALVAPRAWMEAHDRTSAVSMPLKNGGKSFRAGGLMGLGAGEPGVTGMDNIITAGRWFLPGETDVVLLPDNVAASLGIDLAGAAERGGDMVSIWGKPHRVVGIFDHEKLTEMKDLDGEPLTPVTFPSEISMEITEVEMEAMEAGEDILSFQSRYTHVPSEQTIIMPAAQVLAAGGRLKALAVRPLDEGADIREMAGELVDRFAFVLFSGEPGGTFLYNAGNTMNYSGVPNILIPMLISIFIVLNTMISSVYERKKEIGIYTSVGLAPSHVSFLFIAEAMAFAVISGVIGYLVAQTSATLFAHTSLWEGITVNYSSTAGVAAMVLVMGVVMISAIYPSRVAARISIPDVNRTWKLPPAEGDVLNITLPFLMKRAERESIGGFLYSYFNGHQDYSHGTFSTGSVTLFTEPIEMVENHGTSYFYITSRVWLSPFDFGIMQHVDIRFMPSKENAGYLEIHMKIRRESGEVNSWLRINRRFVHEMRKQLLVWRSLDEPAKNTFVEMLRKLQKEGNHAQLTV